MPSIHSANAVCHQPIEVGFATHVVRSESVDDHHDDMIHLLTDRSGLRGADRSRLRGSFYVFERVTVVGRDIPQEGGQKEGELHVAIMR